MIAVLVFSVWLLVLLLVEVSRFLLELVFDGFGWTAECFVVHVAGLGTGAGCADSRGFLAGAAGLSTGLLFFGVQRLEWRG